MRKLTIATIVLAFSGMSSATEWNGYATESVILHGHGHTADAGHHSGTGCGCSHNVHYDWGCCGDQFPYRAHNAWNSFCAPKPCCGKKHFRLFNWHHNTCCEPVCDPCPCDPCSCDPCCKRPLLTLLRSLFHHHHACGCEIPSCGTCSGGYETLHDAGVMSSQSNKQVFPETVEEAPENSDAPMSEEPMPLTPSTGDEKPMSDAEPKEADKPTEEDKPEQPAEAILLPANELNTSASVQSLHPAGLQRIGW